MIEWDDKYSVGISIFDEEHKTFIGIINKAIVAKEHKKNSREILQILNETNEYAQKHFEAEEAHMEKFGYPEYHFHKNEHKAFSLVILEYRIKLHLSNCQIVDDIIEYLQRWLVGHIQNIDRKYTECFNKNALN